MGDPVVIFPFSVLWWKGIIIVSFVAFLIIQLAIRIPPDKRRILMISIGLIMLLREVSRQWYLSEFGLWEIEKSLPLHLCGISAILGGIMMIFPVQKGFEFLALMSIAGALHAFLTPQLNHGASSYMIVEYFLSHGGIILIPIYLAIVEGYRVRKSSYIMVILSCQVLLLFIGTVNFFIDSNYMYLNEKPLVNNPMIIGEWPWYILGFELVGIIHIFIFYFAFRKMKPLPF